MDSIRSIELVNMMDRLAPMFCFLKRKNFSINLRLGKITGDEDTPIMPENLSQSFMVQIKIIFLLTKVHSRKTKE